MRESCRQLLARKIFAEKAQLEGLMIDAFKLRMVSDVPVGMFLSGGIDSSLVTAILQKHLGEQVHTFTIGFNEKEYNEAPTPAWWPSTSEPTIPSVCSKHPKPRPFCPNGANFTMNPLPTLPVFPTYLVSKVASEQVKVVLSADGGDELFSGYSAYEGVLRRIAMCERIPAPLQSAIVSSGDVLDIARADGWITLAPLPKRLREMLRASFTWPAKRLHAYLSAATPGAMYEQVCSFWHGSDLERLTGGKERLRESADAYPGEFAEQMCLWDLHNYLPGDILAKVDRATMAVVLKAASR